MNRLLAILLLVSFPAAAQSVDIIIPPAAAGSGGGTGDVVGPASSTDLNIPRYSGTTGKIITNGSGINIPTTGTISTSTTNGSLTLSPDGTGTIVATKGLVISGVTTDITTGTNEALTLLPNGTGAIALQPGSNTVVVNDSSGGTDWTFTTSTVATRGLLCGNQACMEYSGNDFMHIGSSANRTATSGALAAADSVSLGASTDLFTVYGEGKVAVNVQQAATCAAGVLTLDPTSSVVYLNANSAACAVTLAESNAITGSDVLIVLTANVSGAVTFPNVANVHAGPSACTTTGLSTIGSTYSIHYAGTLASYVGVSCSNN